GRLRIGGYERAQLGLRAQLELPYPLAGDAEAFPQRRQRRRALPQVPRLDDRTLAYVQYAEPVPQLEHASIVLLCAADRIFRRQLLFGQVDDQRAPVARPARRVQRNVAVGQARCHGLDVGLLDAQLERQARHVGGVAPALELSARSPQAEEDP